MEQPKIAEDRLKVFENIKQAETLGGEHYFDDVENDPPPKMLMPEDVDYLKKKFKNKSKNWICKRIANKFIKGYVKKHQISFVGEENLKGVKSGAIITSNHFNYFDTVPIINALKKAKIKKNHHIVIREGNYQIPGILGFVLKNYNTFPLSSNVKTTMNLNKAIDTVLSRGDFLIVYPEQSMWWNYKKPRKYKIGAYRWASRNKVPIIPCFVTMEDLDEYEDNGLKMQKLTLNIGKPIYPDPNLNDKQNADQMIEQNHKFCVSIYEKTYNQKYQIN